MKNEQNADDLSILNKQIEKNLAEVLEGYKKRDQQRLHNLSCKDSLLYLLVFLLLDIY